MFKDSDFQIDDKYFYIKKDKYLVSKIKNARLKKLSFIDNLGQMIFWISIFSAPVWLAIPDINIAPTWLIVLATTLTLVGFIVALFRCSRFALQIKFSHIDETGTQWINVAKSNSTKNNQIFEKQVENLRGKFT